MANQPWTVSSDGVLIDVRLTPRGGRDAIEGIERRADGRPVLKARVRAAPFEGEANAAVCRLLADALGISLRQVKLVAGATARIKRIQIVGNAACLIAALAKLADTGSKSGS